MIHILDFGMGNLGSIYNMFRYLGISAIITDSREELRQAERIVLPGVGAFDEAMKRIQEKGFKELLDEKVLFSKRPVLGICLGMQLLTMGSEEGVIPGLGWISAKTKRFPKQNGLKIPHMGWNQVQHAKPHPLLNNLGEDTRFYFVHSYYVKVVDEADSLLKTDYGLTYDSAICHENIMGVQFHPEKSHKYGMQLLRNFATL